MTPDETRISDLICQHITDRTPEYETYLHRDGESSARIATLLYGELVGLRKALALIHGHNPDTTAATNGPIDQLVHNWQTAQQGSTTP